MPDTQTFPKREITPSNYRFKQPPQFEKADAKTSFQADFSEFQKQASTFQLEAAKFLYDNSEASEHEYRVHCHFLGHLIAFGQAILIQAKENKLDGIATETTFIQQKVESYIATLHDWHGAPGTHTDEPSSFKEAMDDVAQGRVEEGDL